VSWPGLADRLEGELIVLEPVSPEHKEGLKQAAQDPEIWRWTRLDLTGVPDAFDRWFERTLAAGERGEEAPFTTIARASGRIVGSTRYMTLRPADRGVEIGYTWLEPSAWGTGVNVEAKLLMLRRAFEELGCMRVEFKTDERNALSRRALEALPAKFEGVFRKHIILGPDEIRDSAYYSITDDEWPEVKANLLRRLAASAGRPS
jgi:RimJ/RimL family protein N-acetyltransferase